MSADLNALLALHQFSQFFEAHTLAVLAIGRDGIPDMPVQLRHCQSAVLVFQLLGIQFIAHEFLKVRACLSELAAGLLLSQSYNSDAALSRHKAAFEKWLAERLASMGVSEAALLASQIMLLIEGSMSLALIHGDTKYFRSAMSAAERLTKTDRAFIATFCLWSAGLVHGRHINWI